MVNNRSNQDFPEDRDSYLHRVGRAGRFGTKGLAINFIKSDEEEVPEGKRSDKDVLLDVQNGFQIKIAELPKEIDTSLYMWWLIILRDEPPYWRLTFIKKYQFYHEYDYWSIVYELCRMRWLSMMVIMTSLGRLFPRTPTDNTFFMSSHFNSPSAAYLLLR